MTLQKSLAGFALLNLILIACDIKMFSFICF